MEHELYIQLISINQKLDYIIGEVDKAKKKTDGGDNHAKENEDPRAPAKG